MDPVTLLVNAVVAGAAAALKPAAQETVKVAYQRLKGYIKEKWAKLAPGIEFLEGDPSSKAMQTAVGEGLKKAAAADGFDAEVLKAAHALVTALANDRESAAAAERAGVTVEDLRAGASIDIGRVLAEAGPVIVRRLTAEGDIRIGEVSSSNPRGRQ